MTVSCSELPWRSPARRTVTGRQVLPSFDDAHTWTAGSVTGLSRASKIRSGTCVTDPAAAWFLALRPAGTSWKVKSCIDASEFAVPVALNRQTPLTRVETSDPAARVAFRLSL